MTEPDAFVKYIIPLRRGKGQSGSLCSLGHDARGAFAMADFG